MPCRRCNGLMIEDRFEDFADDTGQIAFRGWRCIVCGVILDPLMRNASPRQACTRDTRDSATLVTGITRRRAHANVGS